MNYLSGQRNRSLSIESSIYTVPELTGIVRVIGDYVSIKVRFSFIRGSIRNWRCLVYHILASLYCVRSLRHMRSKQRQRTLALITSGDIKGGGALTSMDVYLTDACLSSKVLSVVWYFLHNCDKTALSSLNARISML